jgi:hypothetical protein
MQSYETLTEIHARCLLVLMKMTDSHRRNHLVEYEEALSIDEDEDEEEEDDEQQQQQQQQQDETYICDHPGSGTGDVETTRRTPRPLLLLGATGTSGTSTSISISTVYKTSPQHAELPALPLSKRRSSCVSMFSDTISTSGWNEDEIVDFYCQNMDEKDDGEEQEDGKPPISPEEEEQVVLAAAAVGPSIEICKMDTSCASLGERKQNSKHRRKRTRRRSSRFSIKSTKNFQSMMFS